MAMTPSGMADYIQSHVRGATDAVTAINNFYRALCEYVEMNAIVTYSWAAVDPTNFNLPDPITVITCDIKTAGFLSPSGLSTPEAALSRFSADLNTQASLWSVTWPPGFEISPAFVLPTINLTLSYATEMGSAWLHLCTQIIAGLKAATPVGSGVHGKFIGSASFISLM